MRPDLAAALRLSTCLPVLTHHNPRFQDHEASVTETKRRNALSRQNGDWAAMARAVVVDGVRYPSMKEAARAVGKTPGAIEYWIKTGRATLAPPSNGTRRYKKVTMKQRLSLRRSIGSGKA